MAIKIAEVTLTEQYTFVGAPVLVEIKIGENNWDSVRGDCASWQDVIDQFNTWQDVMNI